MSSTTTTQYYGLTQYIGTDKPDFADNNTAFRNVDADLHQVVQDSQGFTSDIADLTQRVGNLNTDLTNLSGDLDGEKAKIVALQNKELSQDTEISRVERNAQDMITAYNEASATSTHAYAVGDYFIYNNVLYQATAAITVGATIVPDTNCSTTNVTSELIQLNTSLGGKVIATIAPLTNPDTVGDALHRVADFLHTLPASKIPKVKFVVQENNAEYGQSAFNVLNIGRSNPNAGYYSFDGVEYGSQLINVDMRTSGSTAAQAWTTLVFNNGTWTSHSIELTATFNSGKYYIVE